MKDKGYTAIHKGSNLAGLDWYVCKHCGYETPSETGIMIHIENFHPRKEHTVAELKEIAKANDLPIYGTKAVLMERLEGIL